MAAPAKMDGVPIYLSVVIPAYNEGKRLGATLDRIVEYLSVRPWPFEVIVADDGSSDDTLAVAAARGGSVRPLALGRNGGKGAAVRAGVAVSGGRYVLFTDADSSTDISEWDQFEGKLASGYDVVIGSRALDASQIEVRQPWFREHMGRTFNRMMRQILSVRFTDTQCGFKAFTAEAAHALFAATFVNGFAFDAEILFLAERAGYRVAELPVTWRNSPDSRVSPIRHSSQMLTDVIRTRLRAARGLYHLEKKS